MNEKAIESVLIAQIHIANPRARNRARWQMMVANICEVGLKKPVTVVRRNAAGEDGKHYDLVCGQGRIEAFIALGDTYIPAIVIEAPREDQFLMSLVENIARRRPSNLDILREVKSLRDRGYGIADIARKFGMERMYISGIVHLVEHEESALIASVEAGKLPISVAVQWRLQTGRTGRFPTRYRKHMNQVSCADTNLRQHVGSSQSGLRSDKEMARS